EEATRPLRVQDKRIQAVRGRGIRLEVRHVRAGPFGSVPSDQLAFRIPRLAGWIARGAVVKDAAVGGPCVGPVERVAQPARVGIVAPRHEVALLRPGAGKDPAATGGLAVVRELAE